MNRSTLLPISALLWASCAAHDTPQRGLAAQGSRSVRAASVLVNRDHHALALGGDDPVAGDASISAVHEGALYLFASEGSYARARTGRR